MGRIKLAFCCNILILAHLCYLSCQVVSKIYARLDFFVYLYPTGLFFILSFHVPIYYGIYLYGIFFLCKKLSLVSLFSIPSPQSLSHTVTFLQTVDISYGKLQHTCSQVLPSWWKASVSDKLNLQRVSVDSYSISNSLKQHITLLKYLFLRQFNSTEENNF